MEAAPVSIGINRGSWRNITAAHNRLLPKITNTFVFIIFAFTQLHSSLKLFSRRCLQRDEGHRQSDEHENCFKGDVGETSERRVGAQTGFSERLDTILN